MESRLYFHKTVLLVSLTPIPLCIRQYTYTTITSSSFLVPFSWTRQHQSCYLGQQTESSRGYEVTLAPKTHRSKMRVIQKTLVYSHRTPVRNNLPLCHARVSIFSQSDGIVSTLTCRKQRPSSGIALVQPCPRSALSPVYRQPWLPWSENQHLQD